MATMHYQNGRRPILDICDLCCRKRIALQGRKQFDERVQLSHATFRCAAGVRNRREGPPRGPRGVPVTPQGRPETLQRRLEKPWGRRASHLASTRVGCGGLAVTSRRRLRSLNETIICRASLVVSGVPLRPGVVGAEASAGAFLRASAEPRCMRGMHGGLEKWKPTSAT